jgi:putative PIN family toxin of toxin-antitoxin system
MRAVLDPNVLVSAVLSRSGTPAGLPRIWLGGGFELVVSPALLAELERVLAYPKIAKRVSSDERQELLHLLRERANVIGDPDSAPSIRSQDPDDNYLIALAEIAMAVIVSGDSDLLDLADQIPVHSPAAFLALLSQP